MAPRGPEQDVGVRSSTCLPQDPHALACKRWGRADWMSGGICDAQCPISQFTMTCQIRHASLLRECSCGSHLPHNAPALGRLTGDVTLPSSHMARQLRTLSHPNHHFRGCRLIKARHSCRWSTQRTTRHQSHTGCSNPQNPGAGAARRTEGSVWACLCTRAIIPCILNGRFPQPPAPAV